MKLIVVHTTDINKVIRNGTESGAIKLIVRKGKDITSIKRTYQYGGFIMKLVSLLLGFFSFTLALGSEASGTLLQESEGTTATVSVPGPPSDPDAVAMWIDDLGRLTPFGRQSRGRSSRTADRTICILGWTIAKSASTIGRQTPASSVRLPALTGIVFKRTHISGICILVQSLRQSTGSLKDHRVAVQDMVTWLILNTLGVTHGSCMDRSVRNTAPRVHNTSIRKCSSSTRI